MFRARTCPEQHDVACSKETECAGHWWRRRSRLHHVPGHSRGRGPRAPAPGPGTGACGMLFEVDPVSLPFAPRTPATPRARAAGGPGVLVGHLSCAARRSVSACGRALAGAVGPPPPPPVVPSC